MMSELAGDYECSNCGNCLHNPYSRVCPECGGGMRYMITDRDKINALQQQVAELTAQLADYQMANDGGNTEWNLDKAELRKAISKCMQLEDALDTRQAVYDKLLSDYLKLKNTNANDNNRDVNIMYDHIKLLNTVLYKMCPIAIRACTKLTPPSISNAYKADWDFVREFKSALDDVLEAQNKEYKITED